MIQVNATKSHVLSCQFKYWYPLFSKFTIKSIVLDVPKDFIDFLYEDGIIIPDLKEADSTTNVNINLKSFICEINSAIQKLNGAVFPKLNFSAPSDALWINTGSLKCFTYTEILLLLKSSDRILFDIEHSFDLCPQYHSFHSESESESPFLNTTQLSNNLNEVTLVLRKWVNINPSSEFRCFIINNQLVAISQRDCTTCYSFLNTSDTQMYIKKVISLFCSKCLFPSTTSKPNTNLDDSHQKTSSSTMTSSINNNNSSHNHKFNLHTYVADVYIRNFDSQDMNNNDSITTASNPSNNNPYVDDNSCNEIKIEKNLRLLDISPFGEPTDALLFDWVSDFYPMLQHDNHNTANNTTDTNVAAAVNGSSNDEKNITSNSMNMKGIQLRVITNESEVMKSTRNITNTPIDVTQANDFYKFMDICKLQEQELELD